MDRQVAGDVKPIASLPRDRGALEGQRRELLHLEEVGRSKMRVPIALAGVDARRLDGDVHRRVFRILLVVIDRSIEVRETAADF